VMRIEIHGLKNKVVETQEPKRCLTLNFILSFLFLFFFFFLNFYLKNLIWFYQKKNFLIFYEKLEIALKPNPIW